MHIETDEPIDFGFGNDVLSDREFAALTRTPAGDIVDLAAVRVLLSEEQRLDLTPDDADRVEEWDLEETSLFSDSFVEFGISARIPAHFEMEAA